MCTLEPRRRNWRGLGKTRSWGSLHGGSAKKGRLQYDFELSVEEGHGSTWGGDPRGAGRTYSMGLDDGADHASTKISLLRAWNESGRHYEISKARIPCFIKGCVAENICRVSISGTF